MSTSAVPVDERADLEAFVEREVAHGRYRSREEAVTEAFRLLRMREQKLARLRAEIQVGIEESERGEGTDINSNQAADSFFAKIRTESLAESVKGS